MNSVKRTSRWFIICAPLLFSDAFGLRFSATVAEPPHRPSMTPEEWEKYQNRDKIAEALNILDNPEWYEDDWVIREKREQNARQSEDKRTPIEGYIREREVTAIGTVIETDLPRDKKQELLTKYVSHHNEGVGKRSFIALLRSGMWVPKQAVAYVREQYPDVRGWSMLLAYLPKTTAFEVRRDVAREILAAAKVNPIDYKATNSPPGAEIDAVRVLVSSKEPGDRAMIEWAVRQYPDTPLLWVGLSRIKAPNDLVSRARAIYNDASKPKELRAAAALVFGKGDAATMQTALGWIEDYLREFGGEEEYLQRMKLAWQTPLDPKVGDMVVRMNNGLVLFGALREMPKEVLEPAVERLITAGPRMVEITGPVLARTVPVAFVGYCKSHDKPQSSLHPALYLAARFAPELTSDVHTLIPEAELSNFAKNEVEQGIEPLAETVSRITLWD